MEEKPDAAWSSSMNMCKWVLFGEKIILPMGLFVQVHPARYKKYYFGIQSDSLEKKLRAILSGYSKRLLLSI